MSEPVIVTAATRSRMAFAEQAARWFNQNPASNTYTTGRVEHGELFAIRWASKPGSPVVSVLVFDLPYDAVIVGDLDRVEACTP